MDRSNTKQRWQNRRGFPCSLERVAARSIAASRHGKPSLCSQILDASLSIVDEHAPARRQQKEKKSFGFENDAHEEASLRLLLMGRLHAHILPSSLRGRKIKSHQPFQRVKEADEGPNIVKLLCINLHGNLRQRLAHLNDPPPSLLILHR